MLAVATTVDETGVTFRVRELGVHSVLTCFMLPEQRTNVSTVHGASTSSVRGDDNTGKLAPGQAQ